MSVSYWIDLFLPKSMYKDIHHVVIHNGIDLSVFKYSYNQDVLTHYGINKKYVLGVAHPWSSYKGLGDVIKLRDSLDWSILIVLVGLSNDQLSTMPCGIIGIQPINDLSKLVALYSSAIALVNTTYCDNYPTVNLESIACGTPVITYNTGGSPESVSPQTGAVVQKGNIAGLVEAINMFSRMEREIVRRCCIGFAQSHFNQEMCFKSYMNLYSSL